MDWRAVNKGLFMTSVTYFTDISVAIEEANWLRDKQKRHFKVVQKKGGVMQVQHDRFDNDNRIMWTTRENTERYS